MVPPHSCERLAHDFHITGHAVTTSWAADAERSQRGSVGSSSSDPGGDASGEGGPSHGGYSRPGLTGWWRRFHSRLENAFLLQMLLRQVNDVDGEGFFPSEKKSGANPLKMGKRSLSGDTMNKGGFTLNRTICVSFVCFCKSG